MRTRVWPGRWAILVLGATFACPLLAGEEAPGSAAREDPESTLALRPLPKPKELLVPRPGKADVQRLAELMAQLGSDDPALRASARDRILAVDEGWLPAVAERFERLADTVDKPALKGLLEQAWQQSRVKQREAQGSGAATGPLERPDPLDLLIAHAERSSPHLQALSEVVASSRMLERIGTHPAARRVVHVYVRFGEFLRVDTERALERMGDRSVAALVEATRHPAPRIAEWAERQLRQRGRSLPSEALQIPDPLLRADVLRAYGKIRRLDAAGLLVSYAASEHSALRSAAREAVVQLGEAALWPLRDAYERLVDERAPRAWPWSRVAQELFARMDRQRLAQAYASFQAGRSAAASGDLPAALRAFDQVLLRDPLFEGGPLMAETYLRYAELHADSDLAAGLLAAYRAERLALLGPERDRAMSVRQTLQARELLERGIADRTLLERAQVADPNNQRARAQLSALDAATSTLGAAWQRYAGALTILLAAMTGLARLWRRQRPAAPTHVP